MGAELAELWAELASGPGLADVDELQKRFGFDDEVAALLRERYPDRPVEVGQRHLFPDLHHVLDDDELPWPRSWLPLEPVDDREVLVLAEGKVWRGRRNGNPELPGEPLWDSFGAFLRDVVAVRRHAAYASLGPDRWLTPEAERALRAELSPAAFGFFGLPTLGELRRYLQGEKAAGRVVAAAGLFFLACTLAFLFAPFGTFAARVPFVVVIGSVPFALFLFGMRAVRGARRRLAALPPTPPNAHRAEP